MLKLPYFSCLLQSHIILFLVSHLSSLLHLHNYHPRQTFITSPLDQILNNFVILRVPSELCPHPTINETFIPHTSNHFTLPLEFLWYLLPYQLIATSLAIFTLTLIPAYFLPSQFSCLKISLLFPCCGLVFSLLSFFVM